MGAILLNYDFQIQYLSTNKIGHAYGLSRLIPRSAETFEDTVIAALRSENEVDDTLNSTIRKLSLSPKEIKREEVRDKFIREIKANLLKKNTKIEKTYSLCDNVLLYSESRNTKNSSKMNSSQFPHWSPRGKSNEEPNAFLRFLAWYGRRCHWYGQ